MSDRKQHDLYRQAGEQFAPAIARLAHAIERDPDRARDLEQEIHCELFRSFARFEGASALKTWVYRVAHNVAADHAGKAARRPKPVPLEDIDHLPDAADAEGDVAKSHALDRIRSLIRTLPPLDAQVILLWLEGESGAEIAAITGLSANAVSVRVHRIKALLAERFEPSPLSGDQP